MIEVRLINEHGLSHVLGQAPAIIDRANRSAVLRTARRFEKELSARINRDLDIPRSAFLRGRSPLPNDWAKDWTRVKSKRIGSTGLVWIGYNPIKAGYVGGAASPKGNSIINNKANSTGYLRGTWGQLRQYDWGASARSYLFPEAFLAQMKSGHRGIFKRQGRARFPIVEQVVRIDKAPVIAQSLMPQVAEWHRDEVARQIAQRLAKAAGGQVTA